MCVRGRKPVIGKLRRQDIQAFLYDASQKTCSDAFSASDFSQEEVVLLGTAYRAFVLLHFGGGGQNVLYGKAAAVTSGYCGFCFVPIFWRWLPG